MKRILSLLILISMSFSIYAESVELSENLKSEISISKINKISKTLNTLSSDDCKDNDCHNSNDHCIHHCSGLHSITAPSFSVIIKPIQSLVDKTLWYFANHYKTPLLNPSLKPPANS